MTDEQLKEELLQQEDEQTPEEPVEDTQEEETSPSPEEPQEEEDSTIDKPLSDVFNEEKRTDDTVPLAKYLDMKNKLQSKLDEKDQLIMESTPNNKEIASLAEKYDVDAEFMSEFAKIMKAEALKEAQEKYDPILKKQAEEKALSEKEKLFNQVFDKVSESYSEYAGIINKDIIREMALNGKNADKSVRQLIESVYGGVIKSKEEAPASSFEQSRPSTKKSKDIDFSNLSDSDHDLIASDPKVREEYGKWLESNLNL